MTKISYYTRSSKKGDEEIYIWLRIHHLGQDIRKSTGITFPQRYWSKKRGWLKDLHLEDEALRQRGHKVELSLLKLKNLLYLHMMENSNITSESIGEVIACTKNKKDQVSDNKNNITFISYITEKIDAMKSEKFLNKGEPYSSKSIDNWRTFQSLWKNFESSLSRIYRFEDITINTYYSFMEYCDKSEYKKSTKYQYARIFKAIMNYASTDGVSSNNVHLDRNFITHKTYDVAHCVYLSNEEISKLASLKFEKGSIYEKVRDIFLLGCITGLRFSDYSSISTDNIIQFELDGKRHSALIKIQKKTKKEVAIPILHEEAINILKKYGGKAPQISISGFNRYIKDVCRLAGICTPVRVSDMIGGKEVVRWTTKDRLVSSHTARRSCITNLYLSGRLSIQEIRNISGHKSEQAFLRYICLSKEENVKNILKKLVQ